MDLRSILAGALLLAAPPARAEELTFEAALAAARSGSPALVSARARVEEARSRLSEAELPLPGNPALEVLTGRRTGTTRDTELGVGLSQELDAPGRRAARVDVARARIAQEEARAAEAERETLREVGVEFVRSLEAKERAASAARALDLAREALAIAERRLAAGDVARLDVNVAHTAEARARAEAAGAEAARGARATRLAVLLGARLPRLEAAGRLEDALAQAVEGPAPVLPALRLLDAEIVEAEADARHARSLRWPDFTLKGSYAREEGDEILLGGIGFTLPLVHHGREVGAAASARLSRLRAERAAAERAASVEVEGARNALVSLREAASQHTRGVLPLLSENETLALESYEVGQIGLAVLLAVRRESLDARRAAIEQLVELRLAEVELFARTGASR